MTFDVTSARAVAEFNVGTHDERTPLARVSQLLFDACMEIERLQKLERQQDWPEPQGTTYWNPEKKS